MSNQASFEQLTAAQKANTEVMLTLLRTAFSGLERLTTLNISASRDFFNNVVANTQQMMNAKDASDLAKLNGAFAQPNLDKWMEYSRSLYDLATQMQKELTSVMESRYSTFTKSATNAIEKTTAAAPVGGDVFAAAMQSMLGASTKAFDQMSAMTRQLTEIAEANVQAASNAASTAMTATAAVAKKSK